MDTKELKPCPFCGGPVELERAENTRGGIYGERKWWGVVCRNIINRGGSCAIQQVPSASEDAAIARWNMRAPLAAAGAPDLRSAILALPCILPPMNEQAIDDTEASAFQEGHRAALKQAAALASAAPVGPDLLPEYEVDPMDVVRTLVCIADRMAELPEERRQFYPSPTSNVSPLMIAARNACVERGFTAGGLAIESLKPGGAS